MPEEPTNPAPGPGKERRRRSPIQWISLGVFGLLIVITISLLVVTLLGIRVTAEPWRGQLSEAMTQAIGREVRFEGPMEMRLGLTPSIRIGGITVANPAGFTSPFFARLGQATLRLDLPALLKGEVRVQELWASGVTVHLERNAKAEVNWLFQLARGDRQRAEPAAREGKGKAPVRLVAIDRIELRDLSVDYSGGPGLDRHVFALDRLEGTGGAGQPLRVTVRGSVEKDFPYSVNFTGGPLEALTGDSQPWPVDYSLEFAGTSLRITGSVQPDPKDFNAKLNFMLDTDNLSNLERLLQAHLPPVGETWLSGEVAWEKGVLDIRNLYGAMGQSLLEGRLRVDITRDTPQVTGQFTMPVLDLAPFRVKTKTDAVDKRDKPPDLDQLRRTYEKKEFEFRELARVEADVELRVERWTGIPGDVRDSQLQVSLHGGVLKAPVQATVAEVPLRGELSLDGAAAEPSFVIALGADKTELGQLARLLTGAEGVKGRLGHFLLRFAATGKNMAALVHSLEMKLEVDRGHLTYGAEQNGRPVELRLDRLAVDLPPGGILRGNIRGSLLGEAFAADFTGGDLSTLSEEVQWPLHLVATGSGALLRIDGRISAPDQNGGSDLTIRFEAPQSGRVGRWLGLSPESTLPVSVGVRARADIDAWRLEGLDVKLGRTQIRGDLARVGIGRQPLVQMKLRVENLELAELEAMLPPRKPGPSAPVIELPILPGGIDLTDADVDVGIDRIALRKAPVTDITFTGQIREGKLQAAPFSARFVDATFYGTLALDLRRELPEAELWVASAKPDISRLFRTLGMIEKLNARVDWLQVRLKAVGHRLGEMLERSALVATMESGNLVLGEVNGRGGVHIDLNRAVVESRSREPLRMDLDGLIDRTPVRLTVSSGSAGELMRDARQVPFALRAELAGMDVGLSGQVALPISQKKIDLQLSASGDEISSLEELARTSLPHWGPWELRSRFRISSEGYEMPGLTLRIGTSELSGQGKVLLSGARPEIDMQLSAPHVQLDDFKLEGWALAEKKPETQQRKLSEDEMRAKARQASAKTERMLSPAALRRQDVSLAVDVAEVESGRDRLGGGSLRVSLRDGRLVFGPAEVRMPGGSASLRLGYRPDESGIDMDARIDVDRFDYGVLARRFKPDSDVQGLFSLHLDLKSRTPSLDQAMKHGDGRLDFAVWPKNMKAGVLDLWAVNLFLALIPAVDPSSESKVNCAIGRFDLNRGVLTEDSILIDTSRMRVSGKGGVDLDSEELSFVLVPKPKQPEFFSLATPVEASGKLTHPEIGVSAGAVAGTAARLFTSIVTTPLERVFSRPVPRDGEDVCASALRAER